MTLGDCEAVRDGLLAQPTNSLSSLAFLAVGGWLVVRSWRRPVGTRWPGVALGAVLVANGIGSAWYHGHPDTVGHWLHDLAALALPAVLIVTNQALRVGRGPSTALTALGAMLVVFGLVEAVWRDDTNTWVVFLLLLLALSEVQAHRELEARGDSRARPAFALMLAAAGVAGMGIVLGQSDAATCRPDSVWQFHGLWHTAVAVAAGAYAVAVLEPRATAAVERRSPSVP